MRLTISTVSPHVEHPALKISIFFLWTITPVSFGTTLSLASFAANVA
jgi:hypothetical protein